MILNFKNKQNKSFSPNPLKKKKQCMQSRSTFYAEFATKLILVW